MAFSAHPLSRTYHHGAMNRPRAVPPPPSHPQMRARVQQQHGHGGRVQFVNENPIRTPQKRPARRSLTVPEPEPQVPFRNALQARGYTYPKDWHIGGGAFALVVKARKAGSARPFAVKIMNRPNFERRGIGVQLEREVSLLETLKHKNIVVMSERWECGEDIFIVLEYCSRGDMQHVLSQQEDGRFTESLAAYYSTQLFDALAFVHENGALHRDVKPENLLVTSDYILKLTDFGWAAEMSLSRKSLSGTFTYMAPEILNGENQDAKVDAWSAGAVLYEFLCGKPLLNTFIGAGATGMSAHDPQQSTSMRQQMLLREISALNIMALVRDMEVSPKCEKLLCGLLTALTAARMSCTEASKSEWLDMGVSPIEASVSRGVHRSISCGLAVPGVDLSCDEPNTTSCSMRALSVHVPTPQRPKDFAPRDAYSPDIKKSAWCDDAKTDETDNVINNNTTEVVAPAPSSPIRKLELEGHDLASASTSVSGERGADEESVVVEPPKFERMRSPKYERMQSPIPAERTQHRRRLSTEDSTSTARIETPLVQCRAVQTPMGGYRPVDSRRASGYKSPPAPMRAQSDARYQSPPVPRSLLATTGRTTDARAMTRQTPARESKAALQPKNLHAAALQPFNGYQRVQRSMHVLDRTAPHGSSMSKQHTVQPEEIRHYYPGHTDSRRGMVGSRVHALDRTAPHSTYAHEKDALGGTARRSVLDRSTRERGALDRSTLGVDVSGQLRAQARRQIAAPLSATRIGTHTQQPSVRFTTLLR